MKQDPWEKLLGNEEIKKQCRILLERGEFTWPLLFFGREGIGKKQFALLLAREILTKSSSHPSFDCHLFSPEGENGLYTMEQMHRIQREVFLPPYCSERKVCIFDQLHCIPELHANTLLKLFEEPPAHTVLISISSSLFTLPPTLLSRLLILSFRPLSIREIQGELQRRYPSLPISELSLIATLAQGSLQEALWWATSTGIHLRKQLFSLIEREAEGHYPSVRKIACQWERAEFDGQKEEFVQMLSSLLCWIYRELSFPQREKVNEIPLQRREKRPSLSLSALKELTQEMILAAKSSIKLSHCIEHFFLRYSYLVAYREQSPRM